MERVGGTTTKKYLTTTSRLIANWLNRRGHHLAWNDDLDIALSLCERIEIGVSKSKTFTPWGGWESYLTNQFADTKEHRTLSGELNLWKELRVPTPWVYFGSIGKLKNILVFENNEFIFDPTLTEKSGKRLLMDGIVHKYGMMP